MPQLQSTISDARFKEIAHLAHRQLLEENLWYFCTKSGITLDGKPFSFDRHEYLEEPYKVIRECREMVFEKAAQMGISTLVLLNAFHGCKNLAYPHGVLYLLPSKTDVTDFSKSKAQGILDENEVISKWITKGDTDTSNIKKIGKALLYFRGMMSRIALKTISVDLTVFDEIEEVENWSLVALAEERMSHVDNPSIHRLSVPSIPGYGVDAYFAGSDDIGIPPSDQRYWMIKCEHCGEYNCLEDEFPDCIIEVSVKDQTAIRACKKCRRELNISQGRWVAKEPGRYVRGYHFSQLFSSYINPWKILDQFRKKRELSTLFNDKLGIPYVEAEARLETKEVLALCGSDPQLASFEGPAAMGIDQPKEEGGKFHVTIAYHMSGQPCNIIRVCVRNKWNELADLMKTYNISRCVVDAQPDQAKAREFAKEFQGRVYLCFYAEKQRGAYRWNDDQMTVSVDRTESLNASTRAIHESSVSLPRKDDEIIQFARQLHNIARKKEEDKDTGNVRQTWIKTGADHWRHSYNYCFLALPEIGEYVKPRNDREWRKKKQRGASNWKCV